MAYTTPRSWVAGDVLTAAQMNVDVRDNVAFLANPPACRLIRGTSQSIPPTTQTAVTFDGESYDTDGMHSTSVQPSRITFNTAGLYLVTFHGRFAPASDYTASYGNLRLNGSVPIDEHFDGTITTTDSGPKVRMATVYKFAIGDYVEVLVYHRNVGAVARNMDAATNATPIFSALWVGHG